MAFVPNTFSPSGVNNLNVKGPEPTTVLQTVAVVGVGGIKFSGAAPVADRRQQVGAGGIKFSGIGVSKFRAHITDAGGLKLSGVGVIKFRAHITDAGGIKFSGIAPSRNHQTFVSLGGIKFGGAAPEHVRVDEPNAAGGIKFGGVAVIHPHQHFAVTAAGGIKFSGVAIAHVRAKITSNAGIKFSGHALARVRVRVATTSGIRFGGAAGIATGVGGPKHLAIIGSGGIRFGGSDSNSHNAAPLVNDSRAWRHHAVARADAPAIIRTRTERATGVGDGVTHVLGVRVVARAGNASAKAAGDAAATRAHVGRVIGSIGAVASSQHNQTRARTAQLVSTRATVGAQAVPIVRGDVRHTSTHRASAVIGPDLVEEELDEILFLLEVA